ncbi:leucine-rich repeats and immunoglobulin-like domains protein 1 [Ochlerotatus camptorhynchus]|uniref:leucine-rich repeats and immunoglobulin-like domains protein 1 n=1 Tax=Ochlerotatus camptorhynchus TaxID=644619 RepID=UPI0031D74EBA
MDDPQYERYADLCYLNLTHFNQLSKVLETISPNVLFINLGWNELVNIESTTFSMYSDLEKLVMSSNAHFEFPADGSPMLSSSSLTDFVCAQCAIVKIYNRSLRELPLLEYLELSKNSISQIEKHAFRKNRCLIFLDLSGNMLRWIPSTLLTGLPEMKTIDLSSNRELAPVRYKPFLISNVLEKLKCNDCGFTTIYENTFAKLTNLKEIYLRGNQFFMVQEPVSLWRAINLLLQISKFRLRSTVDTQLSENDLEIISGRKSNEKPTIVTTNQP